MGVYSISRDAITVLSRMYSTRSNFSSRYIKNNTKHTVSNKLT